MSIENRWKQRFQNFEKAYNSLIESVEALENEPQNLFIQDSLIQRYEYSIELAWKTLKDFLEFEGYLALESPKKVIRLALKEGYLKDDLWIIALNDRNKTAHAYDKNMAKEVIRDIKEKYFYLLRDLIEVLKQELRSNE